MYKPAKFFQAERAIVVNVGVLKGCNDVFFRVFLSSYGPLPKGCNELIIIFLVVAVDCIE